MLDDDIFRNIRSVLVNGLAAIGYTNVTVNQRYQPTQQGTVKGMTITMFKVGPVRQVGSPSNSDVWNQETSEMIHTERQTLESVIQIGAQVIVDPKKASHLTASDLLQFAASVLQGETGINTLRASGLYAGKIREIRNPYFMDDSERFEADPSFDFTVGHEQVIIKKTPVVETETFNIYRV